MFFVFLNQVSAETCPDYCADNTYYYNGIYNERANNCEYSIITCEYGCKERLSCSTKTQESNNSLESNCNDYCENRINYYAGIYNSTAEKCEYETRQCKYGCEENTCKIPLNMSCPDYCYNKTKYLSGSYDEWKQECNYQYSIVCKNGCDNEGKSCKSREGKSNQSSGISVLDRIDESKRTGYNQTENNNTLNREYHYKTKKGRLFGLISMKINYLEIYDGNKNKIKEKYPWWSLFFSSVSDSDEQEILGGCGNGICSFGENSDNCQMDCGWCGDGICGWKELNENCQKDCLPACGNKKCESAEMMVDNFCTVDCGYCGDDFCGTGENYVNCFNDCPVACGDEICTEFEIQSDIPCNVDCIPGCGNKICEGGENPKSCPVDCSDYSNGICFDLDISSCSNLCGDGLCQKNENCAKDCLNTCGDGICSERESLKSCPSDCKSPCGDNICTLEDIKISCDLDCKSICGDGLCNGVETGDSCLKDCGFKQQKEIKYVNENYYNILSTDLNLSCGNGICEEDYFICPIDCGYCGDGICQENEKDKCLLDCNHCGDELCAPEEKGVCVECEQKEIIKTPLCGNKLDNGNICINCAWDCGYCGDGLCSNLERKKCGFDCSSACGDKICEIDEDINNCPMDCAS